MAAMLWRTFMREDVRDLIGQVTVPTVVMARPGDRMVPYEASAALAEGIPNARFVTLPAGAHAAFDLVDVLTSQVLDFCERPSALTDERVLATVFFTDIVGLTEQLGSAGDHHWSRQLDVHDEIVDRLLSKYGGRRVNHSGDGYSRSSTCPARRRDARSNSCRLSAAAAGASGPASTSENASAAETNGAVSRCTPVRGCAAMAGAAEILCTRTLRDLAGGSGLTFEGVGPQQLKGLPDPVDVYRVTAG